MRINRPAVTLLLLIGCSAIVLPSAPAYAGDGVGGIDCSMFPDAQECEVSVGVPGVPGGGGSGNAGGESGSGSSDAGESVCRYQRLADQAAPPPGAGAGAWYVQVCDLDGRGQSMSAAMWLAAGEVADPVALAQEAVSRLRLPTPAIRTNPAAGSGVLVRVPVWWWVDSSSWGARQATASVPGMSVTATATPVRVVWSPGDGTPDVVCPGPGTPWAATVDPWAASSCGHTYLSSSAAAPGSRFTLRATVTWSVAWAGGGQSGTVPPLTTTSSVALPVAQSQAIVAG